MEKNRVLAAGATGYLGQYLVKRSKKQGYRYPTESERAVSQLYVPPVLAFAEGERVNWRFQKAAFPQRLSKNRRVTPTPLAGPRPSETAL